MSEKKESKKKEKIKAKAEEKKAKEETISEMHIEQLKQAQQEAHEYKNKYFSAIAELENMRKRLQKEKQEMTRFAADNVILEFLTPIDNFENALGFTDQMSEETRNWARGFEMLLSQFKDVLSTHGVNAFHAKGSEFDTHFHEAVEVEETENTPEGTIIQEFLCGYKRGERILRPARVKVAKKPKQQEQSPPSEAKKV